MAIVVTSVPDVVGKASERTTLNLLSSFDDPRTTGLVARFELYNTALGGGTTNVVLFDQPGAGAPLTVQNFRKYASDGDYTNSIIHRSIPGFVIQGGGFTANGLSDVLTRTPSSGAAAIGVIPTDPPVPNEFSLGRSNLRGTIAMAKLGSDPNSATSQWFFNLADNSANLDAQNGGFTVFGQAQTAADLAAIDAIAAVPAFRGVRFFGQPAFTDLPLVVDNPTTPVLRGDDNLIRYRSITVSQVDELRFTVVKNTNPRLVTARVNDNQLQLRYSPTRRGTAAITVRATNLLGETIEDTFSVRVGRGSGATPRSDNLQGTDDRDVLQGLGGSDRLSGLGGNDQLLGQAGADTLLGGAGSDLLNGGSGNDRLEGGAGSDRLTTGTGRDVVVIGRREGFDTVTDFTDGRDKIELTGGLTFGQLRFRQQQDDTLIQVGRTNLLLLEDFRARALTQADFV